MALTVKNLAKISGVSVRTLHWYDKKGLLKPAYIGKNGYRYYEEEQLLLLQQILFFKELDFSLEDIEKLLKQNDFNKIESLKAHKEVLMESINRKKTLLNTIDKTILKIEGKNIMKDEELYYGFDSSKQKEYEKYIVKNYGTAIEKKLEESKKNTAKWNDLEWNKVKAEGDDLHKKLSKCIDENLSPKSDKVQKLITTHYKMQSKFFNVTKDVYIGLTDLYANHPDFKKFFNAYHPKMIDFISKAIKFYAEKNL